MNNSTEEGIEGGGECINGDGHDPVIEGGYLR